MRLLFAGTPDVAVPSLDALLGSRHEVVAVLTRPDAPAGRGRRLRPSPVAERAAEAGIEVLRPQRPRDPDFLGRLASLAPDCAPIVAYGGLIPPAALAVPRHGWVNLHFSLLPAWRGAAPVQHAVMAGDEVTGACTFRLEEGLDTGPVFGVVTEPVGARDTSGDLLERLARSGSTLLVATLDGIEDGTLVPQPQPAEGVSLAPKLRVEDARVDWHAPALRVDRVVRACTPAPGAWTTWRGERVKLGPLEPAPEVPGGGLGPGEVAVDRSVRASAGPSRGGDVQARGRVVVGTGSHPVALGWLQPVGKRPMPALDWANGVRPQPGERFG